MRNRKVGRLRILTVGVTLAAVAALALASVGSSSPRATPNIVAQAKARIAKYYVSKDAVGKPKTTPKPPKNQNIWVISCDQTLTGCSLPAASIKKAASVLGWKTTIFDGHSNPAEYANGVSQAVAAGADAIVLDSTDCAFAKAPLQQAKAKGILIYGYDVIDCSDPGAGSGPKLLDYTGLPTGYKTYPQFIRDWGRVKADYVIAKTNGKANVITWTEKDILSINYEGQAIIDEFKKCAGCNIVANVDFTLADFANNGVFTKFQTALTQHPEANATATLYDVTILAAAAPALSAAGKAGKFMVAGGEGYPPNIALIRQGVQTSAFAFDITEIGYPTVDALIRLLAHKKVVDEHVGFTLIDTQHNLSKIPTSGPAKDLWTGFFNDAAYYTKLWKTAQKG